MPPLDRRTLLLGLAAILLLAAAVTFARGRGGDVRPPAPIAAASGGADGAGGAAPAPAQPDPVVVHVAGAVRRPGVYRLADGDRVADAIAKAGGPTRRGDPNGVNLAAVVADGEQVLVPVLGAAPAQAGAAAAAGGTVHLNSADAAELDALPGVGPATAQRILAWRQEHGGFASVDDLEQVPGIGPAKLDALRGLVAP